jgi:hypothetical protein
MHVQRQTRLSARAHKWPDHARIGADEWTTDELTSTRWICFSPASKRALCAIGSIGAGSRKAGRWRRLPTERPMRPHFWSGKRRGEWRCCCNGFATVWRRTECADLDQETQDAFVRSRLQPSSHVLFGICQPLFCGGTRRTRRRHCSTRASTRVRAGLCNRRTGILRSLLTIAYYLQWIIANESILLFSSTCY